MIEVYHSIQVSPHYFCVRALLVWKSLNFRLAIRLAAEKRGRDEDRWPFWDMRAEDPSGHLGLRTYWSNTPPWREIASSPQFSAPDGDGPGGPARQHHRVRDDPPGDPTLIGDLVPDPEVVKPHPHSPSVSRTREDRT